MQASGSGIKITAVGQKADTGLPGKQKYQPSRKVGWETHTSHQPNGGKMPGLLLVN